jgi:HSP20 family molecular chaperone IbpA
LAKWSETPESGLRSATSAPVTTSAPPRLPTLDLTQEFAHDIFESAEATWVLIDLPGFSPENISIALGSGALHVHAHVRAGSTETSGWSTPPAEYEAAFEIAAGVEAQSITAVMDNGLLKIGIAKHGSPALRIAIATSEDELICLD